MKVYSFDKDIAAVYGVDCAIMIWNLQYWIEHNQANEMHYHDGRYWTYNSIEAFTKIFTFWSKGQIRRILKSLESQGVIMIGNYNQSTYDRTMWYAFTDEFLQMHLSKSANGFSENENSYIDSSLSKDIDIFADSNIDIPAAGGISSSPAKKSSRKKAETTEPLCLFINSRYSDEERFCAEFDKPDFQDIDVMYYYHAVADWSSQKGKKMKDWIATARNFMRKDKEDGKLHTVHVAGPTLPPDAIKYLNDL